MAYCKLQTKFSPFQFLTQARGALAINRRGKNQRGFVTYIIIHSEYFPVSDWLKRHAWFTITSGCWPKLKRKFLLYWTNDIKSADHCRLLNPWRQNDVKSAARRRLLNNWPRNSGDEIVLFLVSGKKAKWRNSFNNGEIFWMNNKASIEFGFHDIWRILQISESVIHHGLLVSWIPCYSVLNKD